MVYVKSYKLLEHTSVTIPRIGQAESLKRWNRNSHYLRSIPFNHRDKTMTIDLNDLDIKVRQLLVQPREQFFINTDYSSLDLKGLNQLVTDMDVAVEKHLVENLSKLLPQSSFIAEEQTGHQTESPYEWIIDPIDGTTNYVHKIPVFSISLALRYNQNTIAGYVYELNRDELFYAIEGEPAKMK